MDNQYNQNEIIDMLSSHVSPKENEEATEKLLKSFVEFVHSEFYGQTDNKLPYLVFADFCRFLIHEIETKPSEDVNDLLKRTAIFITDLYSSANKNLKDLVRVGIFESLSDDYRALVLADFLPGEIAEDFKSFLES